MSPMAKVAMAGLPAITKNGYRVQLYFLLSSHLVDMPENETLLGLKRESQTVLPCHVYIRD